MAKRSAGLMMYRVHRRDVEVFLVHPGGPYWAKKDIGAWSIPKGEYEEGEEPLEAGRREFYEETGFVAAGPFQKLGTITQSKGKIVSAWFFEGDCDPLQLKSNLFQIEWPPRSQRMLQVPEIDRGDWFSLDRAAQYILRSQLPFLKMLRNALAPVATASHDIMPGAQK